MKNEHLIVVILSLIGQLSWADTVPQTNQAKNITDLNMADLLNVQVTSVSKKAQALSDAPAAVFVISNDDIKRSGVTSVPEALRMAPGIDVAHINASKWAITSRGFNSSLANKLLVLIDGRSVYTPSFSGVYWDAQDVLLDDVDRIEVIRGPGATLWGANAVNGVINIITKNAEKTQGGLITGGGGSQESGFGAVRYGKKLGQDTYGRAYIKGFQRDNFKTPDTGINPNDNWNKQQGGFRLDSRLSSRDEITVQGDIYRTDINQSIDIPTLTKPYNQNINDSVSSEGWNLISRLKHTISPTAEYNLQLYYDHTQRYEFFLKQALDTLDVDFQNSFALGNNHNVIWGLNYRVNMDNFPPSPIMNAIPSRRNTQLISGFVQDEMSIINDKLWFTLGSKFEHNDYTGFEGQPSARLLWAPSSKQRIWASVSRSVRTPSRGENNVKMFFAEIQSPPVPQLGGASLPIELTVNGNPSFKSEVQLSYELGYRFTLSKRASLDITAFYHNYDGLRSLTRIAPVVTGSLPNISVEQPLTMDNLGHARTYGIEAATVWQMTDWWRWDLNYSYFESHISALMANQNLKTPQHKASLRAIINPIDTVSLDFWLRYNSPSLPYNKTNLLDMPTTRINGYITLDMRLAWKAHPAVELSLVGQNLLNNHRLEYIDEATILSGEIPRGIYGKVAFTF